MQIIFVRLFITAKGCKVREFWYNYVDRFELFFVQRDTLQNSTPMPQAV